MRLLDVSVWTEHQVDDCVQKCGYYESFITQAQALGTTFTNVKENLTLGILPCCRADCIFYKGKQDFFRAVCLNTFKATLLSLRVTAISQGNKTQNSTHPHHRVKCSKTIRPSEYQKQRFGSLQRVFENVVALYSQIKFDVHLVEFRQDQAIIQGTFRH